jgi:trehalose 6-phosphate synthase/phosphatase
MAKAKLIIVSNRLPVTIRDGSGGLVFERAIGGLATALGSVSKRFSASWVGWSGLPKVLSAAQLASLGLPDNLVPVQAEADVTKRYYDRFSNRLLWPTMHGMFTSFAPTAKDWEAFVHMNRRFADAVAATVRSSQDLIWVHDYHLLLLPQYLRDVGLHNKIGFFLHTPFPATEFIFGLPHAQELLAGICAADVVGFQTQRDVDNFWQCIQVANGVSPPTLAGAFPIGADYQVYRRTGLQSAVQHLMADRLQRAQGKKVIFSLSRLDYTKGIVAQLMAIQRFFKDCPTREQLVYKLVVAPSREQIGEYKELKARIGQVVRKINKSLGTEHWKPIDYTYENINLDQVVAWYKIADILLLLPEMDGMNLVAKEYIAARGQDSGALVLSTAMGSAAQLSEALLVDARDTEAAAAALWDAHTMTSSERLGRWQALVSTVHDQDVFWWAERFLSALRP